MALSNRKLRCNNDRYKNNFIESAKCITHEMRHIFQIYWANLINDKIARIWKEELAQAKSSLILT
mgnify:CR=1 FL=1